MDKIICVGKNYFDHATELGDAVPEKPVLFLKPPSALLECAGKGLTQVILPSNKGEVHHECEIVVRLNAQSKIHSVTLGLDLTLRELQARLKKNGHPWEVAKVFQHSAITGPWIRIEDFRNYLDEEFSFHLDHQLKQKGLGKNMRLSPEQCVEYASEYFPLCEGDLIFTGTPAGVGPLVPGNTAQFFWGSKSLFELKF